MYVFVLCTWCLLVLDYDLVITDIIPHDANCSLFHSTPSCTTCVVRDMYVRHRKLPCL
jgi:hypothetical protein